MAPRRPRPVRVDDLVARAKAPPTSAAPRRWAWQITTRADGRDTHLDYGRWTRREVSRELARRVAEGDYRRPAEAGTVDELMLAWALDQADRPDLAPLTRRACVTAARLIAQHAGDVRVDRLRAGDVEALQRSLVASGLAASTVRQRMGVLSQAWRWGRARGLTPDRELPRAPAPRGRRAKRGGRVYNGTTPTHEEVAATLDAMTDPEAEAVLRFLWATGARIGGALGLLWGDVDLELGTVTVRGDAGDRAGKGAPVVVPVSGALEELLAGRERRGPGEAVFVFDQADPASAVRRRLRAACSRAGVRQWTPHGLRRRAVRDMISAGVDVVTAASITGHSVQTMLAHYAGAQAEDRQRAAEAIGPRPAAAGKVIAFGRKGTG